MDYAIKTNFGPEMFFVAVVYFYIGAMYSCVKGTWLPPDTTCCKLESNTLKNLLQTWPTINGDYVANSASCDSGTSFQQSKKGEN